MKEVLQSQLTKSMGQFWVTDVLMEALPPRPYTLIFWVCDKRVNAGGNRFYRNQCLFVSRFKGFWVKLPSPVKMAQWWAASGRCGRALQKLLTMTMKMTNQQEKLLFLPQIVWMELCSKSNFVLKYCKLNFYLLQFVNIRKNCVRKKNWDTDLSK